MQQDDPEKMARMHAWLELVDTELGLDPAELAAIEIDLLDLIGVIAHGPSRPGAPLTAFLMGIAVGRGADSRDAIARIQRLATSQPTAVP